MKININKTIIAIGVCALTAAARADELGARQPQMSDMNNTNMNDMPLTSQSFVWEAATTDMKEIHMGEMALQKSDNADVKVFAKELISDHQKSSKKLQAIAQKEGLNLPDTNSMAWDINNNWHPNSANATENPDKDSPPHLAAMLSSNNMNGSEINMKTDAMTMTSMASLSGADFDRAFANHMVMGHEKAISKFEAASANLTDADLKKFADKTLPTLREHLRKARELQSKVGMWSDTGMTNSRPQNVRYPNQ